jgi:hypothetical protein
VFSLTVRKIWLIEFVGDVVCSFFHLFTNGSASVARVIDGLVYLCARTFCVTFWFATDGDERKAHYGSSKKSIHSFDELQTYVSQIRPSTTNTAKTITIVPRNPLGP